ncbi:MAG: stage III sporulation protein AD [Clostridia bacterium]|nr:stage III sporulation protein AD [Clostridia bacterium]
MDIFKIVVFALPSCLLCILLRQYRPDYSFAVSIVSGIIILLYALPALSNVFKSIDSFVRKANVNTVYIKTAVKIMGLSYITQFSSEMCRDAGENALASCIEVCGKIIMLALSLPIAEALFKLTEGIIP